MKWEYKVIEAGKSKGMFFQSKELKDDDLVFSHLDGKPIRANTVTRACLWLWHLLSVGYQQG